MKLRVKRIHKEARLPSYGHPGDAGMDLYAVEDVVLERGNPVPVPTGIQVAIPVGHVGLVWDKSGVSLSGVHRLAGVIDAGYRGEIRVVLINLTEKPYTVERGKKIAQMLIQPVFSVEIEEADNLDGTDRGEGGFGSTGLN
ncbi:MAG: dUTP diphosphatase [Acidobacteria bacterium]|nr:dUTP diphosphatase [Acidobacteriota bacterium]MCG2814788.1 dUTP diphosphatase [Candidatus Aminicenantes bacterium]MBU1338324.1 dUTP diphosphatase [Acidobacteriota bacterium]MBU1475050.1 dUTP diphosphatase [Acidobacteriota bacterium]MBU2437567.1 dUTP diphosphatase [Acidobacteriota bacterium]